MSSDGGGGRRVGLSAVLGVLAVLLAAVGAAALVVGLRAQEPPPPQVPAAVDTASQAPVATPDPAPSRSGTGAGDGQDGERATGGGRTGRSTGRAVEELDYSRPVSLRIPAIGVRSRLVDLGIDDSGAMETPEPEELAGWFTPSPPPGIPGATVIAGHVSWDQRPSVFFRLADLRQGDRVEVLRADGARTAFEVTRLGTFPKDRLPKAQVFDHPAQSELRLITCGGEFDAAGGRHLSNVVVWARIVDVVGA